MNSKALFLAFACALVACSSGTTPTTVTPGASSFVPGPCPSTPEDIPELKTARCGRLTVPEDRHHPKGRKITLAVAIIPAKIPRAKSDPIVWLAGGPGDDAIIEIPLALAGKLNANRDVIFMSQRGTYTADPKLTCDSVDRWAAETLNMPYDAPATGKAYAVATLECRRELAALTTDLGAYNSLESADDLEDLRVALHVAKWNIYGISYGTDQALTYMRRHPGGIRSVGIDGVFPPSLAGGAAAWASAAEGINAVFKACRAQSACRQRYGDIATTWRATGTPLRGVAQNLQGRSSRAFRKSERHDQRRHAPAMVGVAGNAYCGQDARVDRRTRSWRCRTDRINLGRAKTQSSRHRRVGQRPLLRRFLW